MRLTDEDIREFKEAYAAEFHENISDAEAREMADRVMRIVEIIVQCPRAVPKRPCTSA